jgi:hypothetical protein
MESKPIRKKPVLLPRKFKIVGLLIILLSFAAMIIFKTTMPHLLKDGKVFLLNGLILGLIIIALSKDKVEDEMLVAIRLQGMANSFIGGVVLVFISPFIDILFKDPVQTMPAQQVVMFMLFTYLISYSIQKVSG